MHFGTTAAVEPPLECPVFDGVGIIRSVALIARDTDSNIEYGVFRCFARYVNSRRFVLWLEAERYDSISVVKFRQGQISALTQTLADILIGLKP